MLKKYWLVGIFITIPIIIIIYFYSIANFTNDWAKRGQFGDMFGAINSLFSGLAFAGLIYTIVSQKNELSDQKEVQNQLIKESEAQRLATQKSAEHLEAQWKLMNYQSVFSTVIQLIKTKDDYIDRINFEVNTSNITTVHKGLRALSELQRRVYRGISSIEEDNQTFKRYFSTFFYILQFITDSDITDDQKDILGNLLNVHTADTEVYFIYKLNGNVQHSLFLLKRFGFYERHLEVEEANKKYIK